MVVQSNGSTCSMLLEGSGMAFLAQGIHGTHGGLSAGSPQFWSVAAAFLQHEGMPSTAPAIGARKACTSKDDMNNMIRKVPIPCIMTNLRFKTVLRCQEYVNSRCC